MTALTDDAPGKINLTLRVIGSRPDGFHEIESLAAQVELSDTLTVRPHEDGCYLLDCDDPTLPADGSNLVLRAARALAPVTGANPGVKIQLSKRIPAGAGLGGGSSDAAAALRLLNKLWQTGLSREELAQIGASLGSDVPLFFYGPLSVIRGRGEQVEELGRPLHGWAALILPGIRCSTAAVYSTWSCRQARSGPTLEEVQRALTSVDRLMELLFNDLEPAAFAIYPELERLAERAATIAGGPVRMTGSGAGLFRLFSQEAAARRFAAAVCQQLGVRTLVTRLRARIEQVGASG